ncbi:TIGR03087 family PEP-CTERM/XrtA system glycosyltransferase [Flavobacterium sp. W21_SRS_FM6]|uniref:TIGR03087 family PEP-CTERM/XrtA system glycosyltransferase n=1 Tax=Flavobacterium sp. W21_SRS_FM6 TaxID=3240268 RepID=UPI003F93C140
MKEPILFLCHRIPFPPNKGDKITTFNLLIFLSKRYQIHLGCFIDDPFDRQYISELNKYCESFKTVDICARSQSTSGLKAMLFGNAVSTEHYRSSDLEQWTDETINKFDIDKLFVYSSGVAPFIDKDKYRHKTRILDMADIDSDKWRQYAENKPWYTRWIYSREYRILAKFEQKILQDFEAITLITEEEAALFKKMSPGDLRQKIYTLSNGVDTDYFSPEANFDFTGITDIKSPCICFTGAMDYWANEDAVVWFCKSVWPLITDEFPNCHFYIVGGKPSNKIKQLESLPGVVVTGRVVDVRPYIANSILAVAPLRIARGVQNKVLEAMSMAKPVVMTSMGQEGIAIPSEQQDLVQDDPIAMAHAILNLLNEKEVNFSVNREWIVHRYSWNGALEKLPNLLDLKPAH